MRHVPLGSAGRLLGRLIKPALAVCVFFFTAGAAGPACAEEAEEEPQGVQYSAVAGATFTQTNYDDWAEGGEDALSYVLRLKGGVFEDRLRDKWKIDGSLGFGQAKLGKEDTRISANEVIIDGLYNYKLPKKFSAYAAAGFRSALVTGYDYSVTPKIEKASFNDPGYYTLSLGAAYDIKPKPTYFRTRMGLGLKYTTAETHFKFGYADDPDTPEKDKSKLEEGIDSVTELDAEISENLLYVSKLELFARFQALDVWDVLWGNIVTAQINKYVSTQFELVLLFDKDVTGRLQRFQMLSLGITYTFM
jgi:hypothetical protein